MSEADSGDEFLIVDIGYWNRWQTFVNAEALPCR
jgi:hypothetical protein